MIIVQGYTYAKVSAHIHVEKSLHISNNALHIAILKQKKKNVYEMNANHVFFPTHFPTSTPFHQIQNLTLIVI
jgi:hypothetical protein